MEFFLDFQISVPSSETEDSEEAKSNNLLQSKPSPLAQNSTVVPPLPDNLSSSLLEVIVSIKPVSYTHLDVYKRQSLYNTCFKLPSAERTYDSTSTFCCETVSYTHLDVYKRQVLNN